MNRFPEDGHMKFFRTSYSLDVSDPASKETVTVIMGNDGDISTFHLPKCTLKATSEFVARSLKPEWTFSSNRTIHLRDVDAALFDLYARWVASGAEIMIDEDDWKAEYTEYLKWRPEVDDEKEQKRVHKIKLLCPVTVWNFDLTTEAWFLGDFLQSRDFQNHCLGHLYYMHLQFDHTRLVEEPAWGDASAGSWHWGTIAFLRAEDILHTWEMTKHLAERTPFAIEQHPLRRFLVNWMERYWDAYHISDWDYEAQDGIVRLIELCEAGH